MKKKSRWKEKILEHFHYACRLCGEIGEYKTLKIYQIFVDDKRLGIPMCELCRGKLKKLWQLHGISITFDGPFNGIITPEQTERLTQQIEAIEKLCCTK